MRSLVVLCFLLVTAYTLASPVEESLGVVVDDSELQPHAVGEEASTDLSEDAADGRAGRSCIGACINWCWAQGFRPRFYASCNSRGCGCLQL